MTEVHDDRPGSAADALAIIQAQQAQVSSAISPKAYLFFLFWGAAWIVMGVSGFLAGIDVFPGWVAGVLGTAAIVAAGIASAVVGIRSGRGLAGQSTRQGMLYGLCWPFAMVGVSVFVAAMSAVGGLSSDQMAIMVPAAYALVVGALYAASGAVWGSMNNFVLGIWIVVVGGVSPFLGTPANLLFFGVGAGGGMLAVGVAELVRSR
ncbi:hypothetical protein GCM10009836_61700 [Pseudonocardia ailaonensis]|uniref:Transporter n=1 Tax=Pseudonocardia ailaonensis TaxID=367279 RepID=A0ABN2NJT2_9PSEU